MESRVIEYSRPINGLDYHNSPLIGEIAASDYTYYRSIDQLRTTINEREVLQTITNPHASSMINGSVSLIPSCTPLAPTTTTSHINSRPTETRALDFHHKPYTNSVERINGLHEIEVQTVKGDHHHESHPHLHHQQHHAQHPGLTLNRVNHNNPHGSEVGMTQTEPTNRNHNPKGGKGYRKGRKSSSAVNTYGTGTEIQSNGYGHLHHNQNYPGPTDNNDNVNGVAHNNENNFGGTGSGNGAGSGVGVDEEDEHETEDILEEGEIKESKVGCNCRAFT